MLPPRRRRIAYLQVSPSSPIFARICRVDCDVNFGGRRAGSGPHGVDGEDGGFASNSAWGRSLQEFAAFALGFISSLWLTLDTERANAGSRAHARDFSVSSTIHPKLVDFRTASGTSGWDIRGDRAHLAAFEREPLPN